MHHAQEDRAASVRIRNATKRTGDGFRTAEKTYGRHPAEYKNDTLPRAFETFIRSCPGGGMPRTKATSKLVLANIEHMFYNCMYKKFSGGKESV